MWTRWQCINRFRLQRLVTSRPRTKGFRCLACTKQCAKDQRTNFLFRHQFSFRTWGSINTGILTIGIVNGSTCVQTTSIIIIIIIIIPGRRQTDFIAGASRRHDTSIITAITFFSRRVRETRTYGTYGIIPAVGHHWNRIWCRMDVLMLLNVKITTVSMSVIGSMMIDDISLSCFLSVYFAWTETTEHSINRLSKVLW